MRYRYDSLAKLIQNIDQLMAYLFVWTLLYTIPK